MDPLLNGRRRLPDGIQADGEQPDSQLNEDSLELIGQELVPVTPLRSTTAEQGPSTTQDRDSERENQGKENKTAREEMEVSVVRGVPKALAPSPAASQPLPPNSCPHSKRHRAVHHTSTERRKL